ncbi:unnamed protein product, partial [Ectocarpus sp. 12 AP-2014]
MSSSLTRTPEARGIRPSAACTSLDAHIEFQLDWRLLRYVGCVGDGHFQARHTSMQQVVPIRSGLFSAEEKKQLFQPVQDWFQCTEKKTREKITDRKFDRSD